jgi:hypothetical protein
MIFGDMLVAKRREGARELTDIALEAGNLAEAAAAAASCWTDVLGPDSAT